MNSFGKKELESPRSRSNAEPCSKSAYRVSAAMDIDSVQRMVDRSSALVVQRQYLDSLASRSESPIQFQTTIEYGGLKDFRWKRSAMAPTVTGKVASSMHAELDPDYPKRGSDTSGSDAFDGLFDNLQNHTNTTWVRGHLLNHDLGGLAIYNNLFPITTAANGEHYHEVEKEVKHWMAHGCHVTYDVDTRKRDDITSPDAAFVCEADVTSDPKGSGLAGSKIRKSILSHADKADTERVYRNKKNTRVNKNSGVVLGQGNNVLRDDYKSSKKDPRWQHMTGKSSLNNQEATVAALDAIDVGPWDYGNTAADIEAGMYDSEFDQDAFDEWLEG